MRNHSRGVHRRRRGVGISGGAGCARAELSDPAGPRCGRLSARRPDRFRRPPGRRQDDARCSARASIIDNKPGANGTLGGDDVAKSDPDGYSLFLTTAGAVTVSPHIMPNMPFDPLRDFAPVALVTKVTEVLVVSPKLGIKTVKDLVALAKAKARRRNLRLDRHRFSRRISPRSCSPHRRA